jgi:hypothetical protein
MFLLHFLPTGLLNWVINGIILVGIIGVCATWIARYIPVVASLVEMYRLPIQIISVVLLVTGVYWKGGESVELAWRERVAEQQRKIEIAEAKSREANKQLSEEIQKTQKLTKEVKDATKAGIQASASKMDSQCTVDSIAIGLHNSASLNQVPRSTTGTIQTLPNAGTSGPSRSTIK